MFWSILLRWMLIGMALYVASILCTTIYLAARANLAGILDNSAMKEAFRTKLHEGIRRHYRWSEFLYKILPSYVAGAVELCWQFIVWPLDVPLTIIHIKRANDEFYFEHNIGKAS